MNDIGHELTEARLAKLERRIAGIYSKAARELSGTIDEYFAKFKIRDEEMRAKLDAGEITQERYTQWRLAQIGRGDRFKALQNEVAERYSKANEVAIAYTNDATPSIYSLNRNYAAYTIEQVSGNVGFTLWDEQTVKRLIVDEPELMPYYPPKRALKRGIDLAYGKQQISAAVTSGILQGKSVEKIANDLQTHMVNMERSSAIRTARTAITSAQNAGRMDSYIAAEKMGIKLKRMWMATLDNRTRHAHAMLDGQKAEMDKPFKVDGYSIMFPGDTSAPGYLVYNCRCTIVADIEGIDTSYAQRESTDGVIPNMTYQEWVESKKTVASTAKNGIIGTGAKGALTSQNDPDFLKRDSHAKTYYASIRNSDKNSLVKAIAKNADMESTKVDVAINHLFYSKHNLEKGFTYFDEDYDIAESVQRLRAGINIQPHDLILIQHEALEAEYMSGGMPFEEAHSKAEGVYNYTAALRKYLKENNLE